MKIVILGDLHFGKSEVTDKALLECLKGKVFPYIKKHKIETLIQLGDVFDSRKAITPKPGKFYAESFLSPIIKNDLILYQLLGNHDCFYNNKTIINTPDMFFELLKKENINLITEFTEIVLDNKKITFIPWASKINVNDLMGDLLFCHYSINGFEQQRGVKIVKGLKQEDFKNFNLVISGHIHRKDKQRNIMYIGSPIPLDFGEIDIEHGFCVYDLKTNDMEFVNTGIVPFVKLFYEENDIPEIGDVNGKIIKVIARNVLNRSVFDDFLKEVSGHKPERIIVNTLDMDVPGTDLIGIEDAEIEYDIMNVMEQKINELNGIDKEKLYEIAKRIYQECLGE